MKNCTTLLLLMFCLLSLKAQPKFLIPDWKPGDTWKLTSTAIAPSDDKELDENGKMKMDTLKYVYLWKVDLANEEGYVMSLQLLDYDISSKDKSDTDREIYEINMGAKALPPLLYLVKKDGSVSKTKNEGDDESETDLSSLFTIMKDNPILLNDSIFSQYIEARSLAKEQNDAAIFDSMTNAGEPIPQMVHRDISEDIDLDADDSTMSEEDMDDDDWDSEAFMENLYPNMLKETFIKRIELLHTPFGTEIKQVGTPYSVEDITPNELSQLQLTPELMEMFKIKGTYFFNVIDNQMVFESDLSMDMQEMMIMFVKAFEDAFKEEEKGKKKKKKDAEKPKASEQIPSMEMGMKSNWIFDGNQMTPIQYKMLVTTKVEEKGVSFSFEATEVISFEKIQ